MKTHLSRLARQRGLSLIELLVALSIGSFLIIGAVTMQSQTRRTFDISERQSRLQETARYVLSVLEPELQLAGLYGFSQDPNVVRAGARTASEIRQDDVSAGLGSGLDTCGVNFAVDVLSPVEADNDTYTLPCAAQGGAALAGRDVLIIRRTTPTSPTPVAASAQRLQVYSNRLSPHSDTYLFVSSAAPDVVNVNRNIRNMLVNAYYIARDADNRPGTPALRTKILDTNGAAPAFLDQEIIRGVEDLQVQFGIDPGLDLDNNLIPDDPGGDGMADFVDGLVSRWVNPGDPLLNSAQVAAVRVWVRVRAEAPEFGFVDNRRYQYGSTDFTPNDNFRRVVMSRTVFLRNARQQ